MSNETPALLSPQEVRLKITLAYVESTGGEYSPEALAEYILKLERLVLTGKL